MEMVEFVHLDLHTNPYPFEQAAGGDVATLRVMSCSGGGVERLEARATGYLSDGTSKGGARRSTGARRTRRRIPTVGAFSSTPCDLLTGSGLGRSSGGCRGLEPFRPGFMVVVGSLVVGSFAGFSGNATVEVSSDSVNLAGIAIVVPSVGDGALTVRGTKAEHHQRDGRGVQLQRRHHGHGGGGGLPDERLARPRDLSGV